MDKYKSTYSKMTLTTIKNPKQIEETDNSNDGEEISVWPQILAIFVGSLAGVTDGVFFAWTSPFLVKLVEDKVNYDITEEEASNLTIILPGTVVIACLFLFNVSDFLGRKKTLLLLAIPQTISLLLSAFAKSIYVFYLARFFAGIANALLWCSLPIYIGEVASPKVRGVWGNAVASSMFIGQFLVNVVGSYFDVAVTSYILLPIPILFFILFTFMPESPYFLLMKKDQESAEKTLRFLTRKQNVDDDLKKLQSDVERQMSEKGRWKDLLCIDSNLKALWIMIFLRLSQQFCGTSALTNYTQYIMEKAGGTISPQVTSIFYTAIGAILNILVVTFIVDRFKKKHLYSSSILCCSITFFIFGAYFYVDDFVKEYDLSSFSWVPVTALILFQIFFSFGGGIIPSLMLGELFSASIKAKAMVVLLFIFGLSWFLGNLIFNILTSSVGPYAPFVFFASVTFITSILALFIVPETKGKTLEEIQMSLKQKN